MSEAVLESQQERAFELARQMFEAPEDRSSPFGMATPQPPSRIEEVASVEDAAFRDAERMFRENPRPYQH